MEKFIEFLDNNNIYITKNVFAKFGQVFEKYKFQEIAVVGDNLELISDALRKDYKLTTINIPKQLCYTLCGLNLARMQLKENTRLIVAYGDEHSLNITKLLANKSQLPYCFITNTMLNVYSKCNYAIMDNVPIEIKTQLKCIIINEKIENNIANDYARITSQIIGCFEFYLKEKFFETTYNIDTKLLFQTYYEILKVNNLKNKTNLEFIHKLNLILVVEYAKTNKVPFHDNYYLTLYFLSKNVKLFNEFDKLLFIYSQMLSVLYEIFFNNNLQSPLYTMLEKLENNISVSQYSKIVASQSKRNLNKMNYIYKVYTKFLCSMTLSYQKLYAKTAFALKNIIKDSGYELFQSLDCQCMIDIIKEISLINDNSLLYQFGMTKLY